MRRLAATSLRRNVACRLVLLLSGSYEEFQHPKRVIRTVKKMTDMRRFIIDKMPLHFFYTPPYFGHIPLLAVPCRTRSRVPCNDRGP